MARNIARYSISYGLSGCYMPDSVNGPYFAATRKELAALIRAELEFFDMPASLFREVHITRLWQFIRHNGSSVMHFQLNHKGNTLAFHGLTEEEAEQMDVD